MHKQPIIRANAQVVLQNFAEDHRLRKQQRRCTVYRSKRGNTAMFRSLSSRRARSAEHTRWRRCSSSTLRTTTTTQHLLSEHEEEDTPPTTHGRRLVRVTTCDERRPPSPRRGERENAAEERRSRATARSSGQREECDVVSGPP